MKIVRTVVAAGMWITSVMVWATSHHPQDFLKSIAGKPDEGAQIVSHYCANCHAAKPLISVGAPRMGVAADWAPRLKQGMKQLFQHTDEGVGAMPPRGGCFECSDAQLMLSLRILLPNKAKIRTNNTH